MLKNEHEYETPVHFSRYQNEYTDSNISIDKKTDINYTPFIVESHANRLLFCISIRPAAFMSEKVSTFNFMKKCNQIIRRCHHTSTSKTRNVQNFSKLLSNFTKRKYESSSR